MTGEDGKEVDAGEYCSFPTYFNLWKCDFPKLKVSRPVEDICKDCYAFTNRHRYLANQTLGCNNDDSNGNININGNGNGDGDGNNNGEGKRSNDGCSNDGNNKDAAMTFPILESAQLGT